MGGSFLDLAGRVSTVFSMYHDLLPDEVKAFALRWRTVKSLEEAELRGTPPGRRLQLLSSLMASDRALRWAAKEPEEVDTLRARWPGCVFPPRSPRRGR
jgi:hypothetical protein